MGKIAKKPLFVFGDDNGFCSLYQMTKEEYDLVVEKAHNSSDDDFDKIWDEEIDSKKIDIDCNEYGYVPDFIVKLSKIYGFDVGSN